mgnify:CR=1 FL=1
MANTGLTLGDLAHHTVLIVGVGREGTALAHALHALDTPPVAFALEGSEGEATARFRGEFGGSVPVHLFEDTDERPPVLNEVTMAVMSPGIARTSALYRAIRRWGIAMTSSSALFVAEHASTLVGVTGSKGKSTTSTLIHALLTHSGHDTALGGNMGIPLVGSTPGQRQVAELSSYQCHYLEASPDVVVLTALFPEHLDWHGSVDLYFADKLGIVAHAPRVVVANADDLILREELTRRYPDLNVVWVGDGHDWHLEPEGDHAWLCHGDRRLFSTENSALLGEHNHRNMLLALAGASATGALDESAIAEALGSFEGLANRLERIEDQSGLVFVNDSLATNPHAASVALASCSSPGMVWLVGGFDRGVDYTVLVEQVVASTPRHILGLPGSGPALVELFRAALEKAGLLDRVSLGTVTSMTEAIERARQLAGPGDYVLLSPGAPSFGYYRDYQHRADDFRAAIETTQPKDPA